MKIKTMRWVLLLVALLGLSSAVLSARNQGVRSLTILYLNDIHGALSPSENKDISTEGPVGGAAIWGQQIRDEIKAHPARTLFLAGGDLFQGTPISNLLHGRGMVDVLNQCHLTASAMGNHEFDWGPDTLAQIRKQARFSFLAANIRRTDGSGRLAPPYRLAKINGIRLAIIGISTPETAISTRPENIRGLIFDDPISVLARLIPKVRAQGVQRVIIVSHCGHEAECEIARKVPGIDVIVGGHSHTVVKTPVQVGSTVVVQAGWSGFYLGVLHLAVPVDTSTPVTVSTDSNLRLIQLRPDMPADPGIQAVVDRNQSELKGEFTRIVGEAKEEIPHSGRSETPLGDIVTDAMRHAMNADVAIQNTGGIRAPIPAGPISMESVFRTLPFDNQLVMIELSGKAIRETLSMMVGANYRTVQVSGLQAIFDDTDPKQPILERVSINGRPLEDARNYQVVTNDFLISVVNSGSKIAGGENYTPMSGAKILKYGGLVRDAVVDWLESHRPLVPTVEGRLQMKHATD